MICLIHRRWLGAKWTKLSTIRWIEQFYEGAFELSEDSKILWFGLAEWCNNFGYAIRICRVNQAHILDRNRSKVVCFSQSFNPYHMIFIPEILSVNKIVSCHRLELFTFDWRNYDAKILITFVKYLQSG